MKAASLFKAYRKSINPPYTGKDFLVIAATILILLVIPITVLSALEARQSKSIAAGPQIGTTFGPTLVTSGLPGSESVSITAAAGAAVQLDAEEQALLTLINDYRRANLPAGTPDLVLSAAITAAADWMAADMATNNYFSHTDSLGRNPFQRMAAFGYDCAAYNTWCGENIGANAERAVDMFNAWRNSSGHNANMLNSNYKAIGIGRSYNASSDLHWYWVTDFGGVVGTKPDLVPDSITQGTPSGSYQYRFQSRIRNDSSVSTASGFNVQWTIGSSTYTYFTSSLGAGGSRESHQDVNLSPGTYQVCFRVDSSNSISESNEGNNQTCRSFQLTAGTGSIQFRVREVNSSGQPIGFVSGATAKLTNTSGSTVYQTATSDSSGWVRFNNVTAGMTYGILAYKAGFVGKSKQYWPPDNTCGENFTTSGATISHSGYTAAWDNNVLVNANSVTYCHDLGLMPTATASCDTFYPTNRFHACAFDRNTGAYLGGWNEGDLGTPTNNKTLVNHNWGTGTVAFGRSDNIRIIWRGEIKFPASATYKIILCSDDGSRVDLGIANDSSPVWDINFWWDHADSCKTLNMSMSSGVYFPVKLEWYENGGGANIYFEYQRQ